MPGHSATAIANEFLRRTKDISIPAQMQLQKWVYNANGWNLAINGGPLVGERPQAWDGGPVFRSIWDHIKVFGFNEEGLLTTPSGRVINANLDEDEEEIIRRVWRKYKGMSGFEMSRLSHEPGSPWYTAYFDHHQNYPLSNEETRSYFRRLAMAGRV